jgi:spore germination protein GerM
MKRKKKPISFGMLALIALVVFGISGAGTYMYLSRKSGQNHSAPPVNPKPAPPIVETPDNTPEVTIYVPQVVGSRSYLIPKTRTAETKGDILDAAMEALIATNKEKGDMGALIPQGTRLLSPIKISDGIATVNLSAEFAGFSGGTNEEALLLNSIAHTIVKNSGGRAKKVRILIEGEKAELGDSVLDEPITPGSTMLKPEN